MKLKKTEKYRGITGINFENSNTQLYSSFSPFSWNNFFSTVNLIDIEDKDGRAYVEKEGGTLYIRNAKVGIYTPAGRSIDLYVNNSNISGRVRLGKIKTDNRSSVNIDNFAEKLGPISSTVTGIAEDLGYIAVTCVPVAVFGVPLVKFFGGSPIDAIDDFLFLSAGINVGLRGDNKRAFYTSLAVAASSILGPEAIEATKNGLDSGLDKIGLIEDGGKTLAHFLFWGVGKKLREYYTAQTSRH